MKPPTSPACPSVSTSRTAPKWDRPGPDQANENLWILVSYITGEALHDPPSVQEFNLHYVSQERVAQAKPFTIIVTIPINIKYGPAYKLAEPPVLKRGSAWIRRPLQDGKVKILVIPLDDLVLEGGRGPSEYPCRMRNTGPTQCETSR